MADFEGISLQTQGLLTSGALLFLRESPEADAKALLDEGVEVEIRHGVRAVVARNVPGSGHDQVADASVVLANRGLDVLTMNGAGRSALAGVDTTAVWWSDEEDRHLVRFSMSLTSTIRFTATVTVLGADGTPAPRSPEPVVSWQESMRYFRMSELTDDLFDAFRNV